MSNFCVHVNHNPIPQAGLLTLLNRETGLTPSVIANAPEVEDVGRFSSSSPLDLGWEPVDLGRELPLVPGLGGER